MTRCSTQKKTASGWGARQAAIGSHFRKHSTAYTRAAATASGVVLVFGCIPSPSHATMSPAQKCAGAEHTLKPAVATPTDKRRFVMPEHSADRGASTASRQGYGQDAPVREAGGMTGFMCSTSCPPYALEQAADGFLSQPGA